jgi:hypothetical protein
VKKSLEAFLGHPLPGSKLVIGDGPRRAALARAFSWRAAGAQCLEGLAPIPLTRRAAVAVGRSSAMIERIAARRQPSQAGEAN